MKHYAVTVKAVVSVLAISHEDAERVIKNQYIDPITDYLPEQINFDCTAYETPNQSDAIKRRAINFEDKA